MEIVINPNDIKSRNIIFHLPVKNANDKFKNYYKIIYSNSEYSMKYVLIELNFAKYEIKYNHSTHTYNLFVDKNDEFMNNIKKVEYNILSVINRRIQKNIVYSCFNEVKKKTFLYHFKFHPNIFQLYLKISGVWEDDNNVGLVYKIYYNTSTEKLFNIIC